MNSPFRHLCASLWAAAAALLLSHQPAGAQQFRFSNPEIVSETRVDRTVFEYTMRARLTNNGATIAGLSGSVVSTGPKTTVVAGSVNFGDVPAGETTSSAGTLTVRHDRSVPFDPTVLKWTLTAPPVTPVVTPVASPTSAASVTVSGIAGPGDAIEITGGAATATTTASGTGAFSTGVSLQPNWKNRLYITATNATGQRSAATPLEVTQDGEAPSLYIDFPADGAQLTNDAITVAGRVGDMLSGFAGLAVSVNGQPANVVTGIGTNGTYERGAVPLIMGVNNLSVTATDVNGNAITRQINVTRIAITGPRMTALSGDAQSARIYTRLADPIAVQITNADGTPFANKIVTFDVTRSDGRLAASPLAQGIGVLLLQVPTDAEGKARAWWWMGGDAGCGNNRVAVTSRDIAGTVFFCASALAAPARQINIGSMGSGSTAIACIRTRRSGTADQHRQRQQSAR